jgi:IS5 family transposase
VAGLFTLKHLHNLSDEALCERRVENSDFQYVCVEVVFQHGAPFVAGALAPAVG